MKVSDLDTPVLVLDIDVLKGNIEYMRDVTRAAGIHYRPHTKTHKSSTIAHMQRDAGAVGVCCAKLGEAEVMAANGVDNILITTPVIGENKIGRLIQARNQAGIAVVADHESNIAMLAQMARASGTRLDVLVEIDVGQGRCGVSNPSEALRLAQAIDHDPVLRFGGIQGYQGRLQMIDNIAEREAGNLAAMDRLKSVASLLEQHGVTVPVRTGGGTGTSPFDLDLSALTEIQPGSYVFMDAVYGQIGWPSANRPPFRQALHILTAVISKPEATRVVVDAGLKAASSDHGAPTVAGYSFEFAGDEHGVVRGRDNGEVSLSVGDKLQLVPSHCDTTVNLHDQYIVIQGDSVVDVWPIEARGKTQ